MQTYSCYKTYLSIRKNKQVVDLLQYLWPNTISPQFISRSWEKLWGKSEQELFCGVCRDQENTHTHTTKNRRRECQKWETEKQS